MTERVAGLEELTGRFDAFLVDQFGVLLGGDAAYPWAPAALARLAATGKPVVLLSNSGRRSAPNIARLRRLGFDRGSFQTVLSSGEAAHAELKRRIGVDIEPGTAVLVLSRENDMSGIDGLALHPTEDPETAELILLAGSCGDVQTLEEYEKLLADPAQRGALCICTNPDITMLTDRGPTFGAGRIAQLYEALGGPVERVGKPHPLIYRVAGTLMPGIAPCRILCIGDSPEHDVRGGQASGHATALVRTGIHADLSAEALADLCEREAAVPDFLLPKFDFSM